MAGQVKFISTRPNANADFWWTNPDTTIATIRNQGASIADQLSIPHEVIMAPDGLTCTMQYTVESQQQWQQFANNVTSALPTAAPTRNTYHQNNNHTLKMEATDGTTILKEVQIVPTP